MALLPYVRLSLVGNLGGSQTWSFGMSFGCPVLPGDSDIFAWLTAIGPLFNTWSTGAVFAANNANVLHATTLSAYGYDAGATKASVQAAQGLATPIVGTGTSTGDYRQAVVATFTSGRPGRHGMGRIYIPWTGSSDTATLQLNATDTGKVSTATATLLDAIKGHNIGAIAITPVIAAKGSEPYTGVTGVIVRSRFKTQRRRSNKIADITTVNTSL